MENLYLTSKGKLIQAAILLIKTSMKSLFTILSILLLSACSFLKEEDSCTLLSEPLSKESIVSRDNNANVAAFNNTFVFRGRRGVEVFYQPGDCYIGDYSTEWSFTGEGSTESVNGNLGTLEALSGGSICVVVSASGNRSEQVCQEINFIKNNVWKAYADEFPSPFTHHRVILNIDSRIFSGFGMNNDWFELDTATFTWTERNHIPNLVDFNAFAGFSLQDKGYLVGNNSILYEYSPATDSWSEIGNTPFNVAQVLNLGAYDFREEYNKTVLGLSMSGKGYFGLGDMFYLWEYDPSTKEWTEKAQYPERPGFYNHGFSYEGKIFFGNYIYDPTSDSWKKGNQNFNVSEKFSPGFVEMDGKILGAQNGRSILTDGNTFNKVEEDDEYLPYKLAPLETVKNGVSVGRFAFFVESTSKYKDNSWYYYIKN
jgi:hypothetical protein